ncbi:MAG: hypothetical protein ACD_2C00033G0015 [uncultured bacterium (gcode 4)]|uniref:Uncharacterized protein n=1 Tax=uncultured bacterium (gcode 4) TaxID=1234023 RepID=K2GIC3_9BACT|nr:MAG: hypothetical protein ACD_2C00033G0015 [uncultured bacterium (gcode 4)]
MIKLNAEIFNLMNESRAWSTAQNIASTVKGKVLVSVTSNQIIGVIYRLEEKIFKKKSLISLWDDDFIALFSMISRLKKPSKEEAERISAFFKFLSFLNKSPADSKHLYKNIANSEYVAISESLCFATFNEISRESRYHAMLHYIDTELKKMNLWKEFEEKYLSRGEYIGLITKRTRRKNIPEDFTETLKRIYSTPNLIPDALDWYQALSLLIYFQTKGVWGLIFTKIRNTIKKIEFMNQPNPDVHLLIRNIQILKCLNLDLIWLYTITKNPAISVLNRVLEKKIKDLESGSANTDYKEILDGLRGIFHLPWLNKDIPIISPNNISRSIIKDLIGKLEADIYEDNDGNLIFTFPVCMLWGRHWKSSETPRREWFWKFTGRILYDCLTEYGKWYEFRINELIIIVREILKNSLDHTDKEVYFWIRLSRNKENTQLKISFIVADNWDWIRDGIIKSTWINDLSFEKAYEIAGTHSWSSVWWENFWVWLWALPEMAKSVNMDLRAYDNWQEFIFNASGNEPGAFKTDASIKFYIVWEMLIDKPL